MFSSRRLAKRSIIGTRVCAPWSDGRFYPGQIQSTSTWPNGEEVYSVIFDGDGATKTFRDVDLIGPGFHTITSTALKRGQKVFITHQGREVKGVVRMMNDDDVQIELDDIIVHRRLEEVRVLESRRSARLQDQGDQDYSRLADVHPPSEPGKKRTVSHVIDVPIPAPKQRRSKGSASPSPEMEMSPHHGAKRRDEEDSYDNIMDERTAAMVLTTLSCSPVSPVFPMGIFTEKGSSPNGPGSSIGSSGVWGMKGSSGSPSPPQFSLSQSAPSGPVFGSLPNDEGLSMDSSSEEEEDLQPKRKRMSTRMVFKCTWPGCEKVSNIRSAMEHHVRNEHLKGKPKPAVSSDSDSSDHEEEFYYTEEEVSVDTVTRTFADMYTSSQDPAEEKLPPSPSHIPDHDYPKKSSPMSIPWASSDNSESDGFPASFPSTSGFPVSSWQSNNQSRITKSAERLSKPNSITGSSPRSISSHKKSRSEVKKCRKVYGMENRDMWCTQCKWKKACSRFMD
ncbi:hypothetical protein CAPTEDRAFT_225922 [Capitella teleta]|uniref:C2H2-type domain-containing protein n=1 Tax=Capitella teleta TaxID=283909 RepID=R7V2F4_CAPTE|nr:hypothetical protein CAPTEDRAFT_225922 [Capitella teleta]|eukprot:ELU09886.1 hypothetical protein CAPTEDRAFT_225922 [Capitella teleta]